MCKNGQNVYFTHLYTIIQELMWMLLNEIKLYHESKAQIYDSMRLQLKI